MVEKIFKLLVGFAAAIPIHHYVMPELLQFVQSPGEIGQTIMYLMISIVIYELLNTSKKWKKLDKYALTVIYYVSLLYVLFARDDMGYSFYELNLVQLWNGLYYGSYAEWIVALFNILIFIPMPIIHGFYLKKASKNICLCILIGILIEFVQAVSHRGVFDIGDIILYFVGIGIGVFIKDRIK